VDAVDSTFSGRAADPKDENESEGVSGGREKEENGAGYGIVWGCELMVGLIPPKCWFWDNCV
jgi:hypothetical protein